VESHLRRVPQRPGERAMTSTHLRTLAEAEPHLAEMERVHRQLRPRIRADYRGAIADVLADRGELLIVHDETSVLGLALFRSFATTFVEHRFYVDDLITDEARRGTGVGAHMIEWLSTEARRRGATELHLESGTPRTRAHRFYLANGFEIFALSFRRPM
jgi:GNAT superfamily N-acetyltransferase